jgi:hypothetical protein
MMMRHKANPTATISWDAIGYQAELVVDHAMLVARSMHPPGHTSIYTPTHALSSQNIFFFN